jgi:hypothetical protein
MLRVDPRGLYDAKWRGCTRKRGLYWPDARRLSEQHGQKMYRCRHCSLWHLTSK